MPTPAVLRRETGEVAVFVAWPTPGAHIEPEVVTTVEGAESSCPTAAPAQISGCAPPEAPESSTSRKADRAPLSFHHLRRAIAIGVAAIPSAAGGLLSDPMSFLVWWDSVGTASAAITIVHLFAIAGFAYVAVVAALIAVADILRLGALRHTVLRAATPRPTHTTAGAFVAVSAAAPAIADESSIIITDIGSAASITEIVLHDVALSRSPDRRSIRVARHQPSHATSRFRGAVDHR